MAIMFTWNLMFLVSLPVLNDVAMPHYDLDTLLRMGYTLPVQKVDDLCRLIVYPAFSVNGHKWRFPQRIWLYMDDERLRGERVRVTAGVDQHRIFRIYLHEVLNHPEIPVNRFLPMRVKGRDYRSEGTSYSSMIGGAAIGRSIDHPSWHPARHLRDTIAKFDWLLAQADPSHEIDVEDDYNNSSDIHLEQSQPPSTVSPLPL
jgi:hypothetical protein